MHRLFQRIEKFYKILHRNRNKKETILHGESYIIPCSQKPPPQNAKKINFDATWFQDITGLGFIVTYHYGRVMHSQVAYSINLCSEEVETTTLYHTIQYALTHKTTTILH